MMGNNENNSIAQQAAIDLTELEALARAATPGPWTHSRFGAIVAGPMQRYSNGIGQEQIAMTTGANWMRKDENIDNAHFIAAANPAAILNLIAMARPATSHEGKVEAAMPLMRSAFRTENCGGTGDYTMTFRFKTLEDLHRAGSEWRSAAPERSETPADELLTLLNEQKADVKLKDGDWWRGYEAALHWIGKAVSEKQNNEAK